VATDSDGINGDTHDCLNNTWWETSLSRGRPLNLEPQSMGNRYDRSGWQSVVNNVNSWGEGWYGRLGEQFAPMVSAYKIIEHRHLTSMCNRRGVNKTNEVQTAFFNGAGCKSSRFRCVFFRGSKEAAVQTSRGSPSGVCST